MVKCTGGSTYIGETGRTLQVCLKEHKMEVSMEKQNNGIVVHAKYTGHNINWNIAKVICRKKHW